MKTKLSHTMLVLGIGLFFISLLSYAQTSITISPANPTTSGLSVQFSGLNPTLIPLQSVVTTQYGLSVGYNDVCAVLVDGTVRCWGDNTYGQLGDGTTTQSATAVQVSGIGNAKAVATGERHACALLSDSTIACWGDNTYGQLGNGTNTAALTPVKVLTSGGANLTAQAISAGDFFTCALSLGYYEYCWGDNSYGQLGNGTTTGSNVPVVISGSVYPIAIASGRFHNCAIVGSRNVYCWGDNTYNELGILGPTQSDVPVEVAIGGYPTATEISAGGYTSCISSTTDDELLCWGSLTSGGAAINDAFSGLPLAISDPTGVKEPPGVVCYIAQNYQVYCDEFESTWEPPVPVTVSSTVGALGISGNGDNSANNVCAYLGDGTVSCWLAPPPGGVYSPFQITNYLLPSGGTSQTEVAWSSSNTGVATISATGYAVPVGPGVTTITATYASLPAATTSLTAQEVTLSLSPNTLSVPQSGSGTSTVTITGAVGSVSLSATGLPSGVTAAFNPNPATSTSTLTLTVSASATTGAATVTVMSTSGSLTATTTLNLTVTPPPSYALSANPSSVNVEQGSQGTTTITITPANGFTGSVTLSATGLPVGVTSAFNPNPATSTSTLTLAASATATTGTATVTVSGISGSLTETTPLGLTVTAPATTVTLTPASLAFGNHAVDTPSTAKSVTLKNTGTATLNISGIGIEQGTYFAISSNTCGATLAPDKTCKVDVTFTPTQLSAEKDTLSFTDNASGSPQTVALSGTGEAQATLTPASLTFAKQKVGTTSAAKKVTLKNNLPTSLTVTQWSIAAPFAISATTCGTVNSGKSCTFSVTFSPTQTGSATATLFVTDGANNSPQTVSLSGTGD